MSLEGRGRWWGEWVPGAAGMAEAGVTAVGDAAVTPTGVPAPVWVTDGPHTPR